MSMMIEKCDPFPHNIIKFDVVRENNECVDARIAFLESELERLNSVRETLEMADDESVVDTITSLQNDYETLENELNE